jgi:dienelactone hydrolase
MSDDDKDQAAIDREFRLVVDRFIHLANEQLDTVKREHVSLALLYAAARFNSFIVSTHAPSKEKFEEDRPAAFKFFTGEYHRMLEENLDDYQRVYDARAAEKPKPEH